MSVLDKLNQLRKGESSNKNTSTDTSGAGFDYLNNYFNAMSSNERTRQNAIQQDQAEQQRQAQELYNRYGTVDLPSQRQKLDNLYEQEAYAKLNDIGSKFAGYGGYNPDFDEIMAAGERGRATLANLPDLDEMEKEYAAAKQYQDASKYSNLLNDPSFMSSAKQGAGMTGNLADAQRNYASNLQESIGGGYLRGLNSETPRTAEGFNALLDPSNEDSYFNFALRTAVGGAYTDQQKQVNLIQNMTQEEIDLYHALLAREGEDSANAFLDYMAETLNQRGGSKVAEWLDDKPLREIGYSIPAGFDQWYSGTKQTFSKDTQPTSVTQYASQQVRENLGDAGFKLPEWMGGSSIGQTLYDIGSTTANMAPSIMAGALLGGAGAPAVLAQGIGAATMGAGVYGNSYQQALKEGFTKRQASNYAALTSLAEGSLQYLLGGISAVGGVVTKNIASKAMQNIGSAIGRIATSLPINMLGEGVEEYLQEILDPVFRNLAFDENNEVKLFTPEAAYSGILGALTAGFLEGPVNISNNIKVAQYGKMVIESNHTDALVQSALGMPEGAASRELAQRISNGEVKPGNANVGELVTKYAEEGGDTSFLSIPVEEDPAVQKTAPAAPVSEETAQATPRQAAPENIAPAVPEDAIAATRNDTRQEVGINGIESVENGSVFVELSDGSVAPLSDVTLEDPDLEEVYETAGLFDTQTAKAFIAAYDGSVDAKTLYSGFTALYGAARKGIPFQQAVAQNQLAVEDLPDSVQAAAYAAGKGITPAKVPVSATYRTETAVSAKIPEAQQAAPVETTAAPVENKKATTSKVTAGVVHDHKTQLSKTQRRHVKALDAFAKAIGRKFVVQDNIYASNGKAAANVTTAESKGLDGVNAYFDPSDNTYYISLDSVGQALMFYAMHENVHDIAKNNREGYNNLQKIVFDVLGEESVSRAREIQRGLYPNESEAYIDEEIVANTVPAILSDPKTYEELARRVARSNSKTRQAFEALLKRLEQTFKRAYQVLKGEKSWEQLKQLEQDMESIKRIRAAYLDALEGLTENPVAPSNETSRLKFSVNPEYADAIDHWDMRDHGTYFTLGRPGEALLSIGIPDAPIQLDQSKAVNMLKDHPEEMNTMVLKALPELLDDPIVIAEFLDGNAYVFGELFFNNKPIGVMLRINSIRRGSILTPEVIYVNKVRSAQTRTHDIDKILLDKNIRYLGTNKKRTDTWFQALGRSTPFGGTRYGSISMIHNPADSVNTALTDDLRFSLKDTSAADVTTLKAQNKKLTEALEVAKAQTKLTKGKHVKPSAIKTYANRILRETKSSYDAENLIENLTKIYDYLGNATDPDMDLIEREGIAMTKAVLEKSSETDNTIPEMYSDAIEYLKTTPISLNETQRKEAAHSMDSYGNYRRALMGNTNLTKDGLNLDIAWQELSEMHPDLFPADTTSADMPGMLYAAVQAMKPTYRNPYGYDIDGAAADLFLDMFMAYADMPLVQTFADRKAAEKQAAVSKQKEKTEAAKAETKAVKQDMAQRHDILSGMHKQEMAKLRKELNAKIIETRREARKAHAAAMREAEQIQKAWREQDIKIISGMYEREMMKLRKEKRTELSAERKKYKSLEREATIDAREWERQVKRSVAETIAKERAAFAEWKKERKTNATAKKYRDRITANLKTLTRWLTRPDKTHHVPEELRQPVANFVQSISFESENAPKRSASWRESMRNLRDAMVRANEKGGTNGSQITLDPDFITSVDDFIGNTKEIQSVSGMDVSQLSELDHITAVVMHTVTTANQMLAGQKAKLVADVATDSIRDMNQRKARKPKGELGEKIDNLLNLDNVDSFSYFERLGDTAYESVFRPLRDGFNKKIINIKKASDYMDNVLKGKDINNWTGKNAEVHTFKFKPETTFTLAGDVLSATKSLPARELQLTTAQIMELYLLNQREQARGHIYGKGIRPAETVGKIGKKTVKISPVEPVMVTEANVDEILSVLTNEQKAVADAVQKFMENEVAEWGNDVSLTLYNYKKFTAKHYYPIVSDANYTLTQDPAMQDGTRALENMGITRDTRENANNAIIVGNIFETFTDHVDKMSSYNAYVVPVSDALKWYNYQDSVGGTGSTKQAIERITGKKGQQYFMNFMRDLNGTNKGSYTVGLADAIVRNTKTAAVGANLRVIVQQPTSYARAAAMISPKYLSKAIFKKSDAVKARKYAPIAQWKTWGFYETSIGKGLNEIILGNQTLAAKLRDKSLALAGKMDDFTWGKLWNACELEIKATRKDLEVGSEEYYQAVGKRLSDIVDRTQVVDSVFHRSQLMRSKDNFSKIYTAFGSEPNKSYNMLRNAVADIYQNPKDKSAQKKLGRVAVTFLISNTLTAAFAAVVDAMRDDDDEQKFIEKYWEALGGNVLDNVNPVNMIPYVKDIASLFYGYSSSRMDLQAIEKLVNLGKQVGKMVNGESKWSVFKFIKEGSSAVSSITGIPAGSLVRDLMAIYGTIAGDHLPMVTELSSASGTYDVVYKAFTDGNAERGQKLLDKLYADKVDELVKEEEKRAKAGEMAQFADRASLEASARNSIERGMADVLMDDPRIAEAYELREKGMITELKAIYKEIQALGFKQDMVTRAINSYANNMAKAPSEVSDDDLKMYTTDTLFAAVERGDSADIDAAFKELVKYSYAADPEKSITNSVKSEFKKRYLAQIDVGNLTKANQLADYVLDNFDLVEPYHIQDWVEEAYQEVYMDNPNSTLEAGLRNILYSEYGYQDWRMEDLQENAVNLGLARKITAQFPDLDEFVTAERAAKYYEYAQPVGISVPDAFGFFEKTKGIQAIKDNEGETIKSKQEQIWEVIDNMNITRDQKDALHLMNYAASTLKKTPWH